MNEFDGYSWNLKTIHPVTERVRDLIKAEEIYLYIQSKWDKIRQHVVDNKKNKAELVRISNFCKRILPDAPRKGVMMTLKELAEKLDGRQYRNKIYNHETNEVKQSGIVIVLGASDDLMEFYGAIRGEIDCYGGGTAHITPNGLLKNKCEDCLCPYYEKEKEKAKKINAIWDRDGYSWIYETDIPHETFDIFEDEEKYCRGIVFYMAYV